MTGVWGYVCPKCSVPARTPQRWQRVQADILPPGPSRCGGGWGHLPGRGGEARPRRLPKGDPPCLGFLQAGSCSHSRAGCGEQGPPPSAAAPNRHTAVLGQGVMA